MNLPPNPSFLDIDHHTVPVLLDMEHNGILVDQTYFIELALDFKDQEQEINAKIDKLWGDGKHCNPKSPGSMGDVGRMLMDMGIFTHPQSTDKETLSQYKKHEIVRLILDYRQVFDLRTKFCENIGNIVHSDGRIRTTLLNTRTYSGRLASKDPNLQNQPSRGKLGKSIRAGYIAVPECSLVSIDDVQIELVMSAHMSQDKEMLRIYRAGGDIHGETTVRNLEMLGLPVTPENMKTYRPQSKTQNFGILYDMSKFALHDKYIEVGIVNDKGGPVYTEAQCQNHINSWFKTYRGIFAYRNRVHADIRRNKHSETLHGRRRLIHEVMSTQNHIVDSGLREGFNHIIQGTAAEIMKLQMVACKPVVDKWADYGVYCKMIMQIHDELLFEIDDDWLCWIIPELREAMMNVIELSVPIGVDVEVGKDWGNQEETHEYDI